MVNLNKLKKCQLIKEIQFLQIENNRLGNDYIMKDFALFEIKRTKDFLIKKLYKNKVFNKIKK